MVLEKKKTLVTNYLMFFYVVMIYETIILGKVRNGISELPKIKMTWGTCSENKNDLGNMFPNVKPYSILHLYCMCVL